MSSEKQRQASDRNWKIHQLRGAWFLFSRTVDSKAGRDACDEELKKLGALPMEDYFKQQSELSE